MRMRGAESNTFLAGAALCFIGVQSFAQAPADDVTALSPDERPMLLVQRPPDELLLARRPSLSAPRRLALSLGLGARPHENTEPLPGPWRTSQPDRGMAKELSAALG